MRRRLEDKIRELCARSVTSREEELTTIAELRAALREHVERTRTVVAATNFASAKDRLRLERRSSPWQSPLRESLLAMPQESNKKRR
jgi:hypothetical protein